MEYLRDVLEVLSPERVDERLRCCVTLLDRDWPLDTGMAQQVRAGDFLTIIGFKAFLDGTLGSRSARMLEDYTDQPGNRGLFVELAAQGFLHEWAAKVAAAGYSPSMHAIGDEAVRLALDVVERLPPDAHSRIEHAQTVHPADIGRFRNRIASMQPLHKADDGRFARSRLGSDRLSEFFPFRKLRTAGATLAFGSDWPIVSPDPLAGIRAAVTGLTFENQPMCIDQNLMVEEVLCAYTRDAAHCLCMPHTGLLSRGALADLTVLDQNPFTADWTSDPPRVLMTIVGGSVVFDPQSRAITLPV